MNVFKNNYKYILLLCCFLVNIACKEESTIIPPKDLLDEKTMARVLVDFLLIENYNNQFTLEHKDVNYDKLQLYGYPVINEKYGLTDSQAFYSYKYYLHFPERMKNIFAIAQDSLILLSDKPKNE